MRRLRESRLSVWLLIMWRRLRSPRLLLRSLHSVIHSIYIFLGVSGYWFTNFDLIWCSLSSLSTWNLGTMKPIWLNWKRVSVPLRWRVLFGVQANLFLLVTVSRNFRSLLSLVRVIYTFRNSFPDDNAIFFLHNQRTTSFRLTTSKIRLQSSRTMSRALILLPCKVRAFWFLSWTSLILIFDIYQNSNFLLACVILVYRDLNEVYGRRSVSQSVLYPLEMQ